MALGFAHSRERPCPCGSGDSLLQCCGPLHRGRLKAETAEQLMRSRYSAYVLSEVDYLIATHPDAASPVAARRRELRASCRQTRWHGLKVLASEAGRPDDLEVALDKGAAMDTAIPTPKLVAKSGQGCLDSPLRCARAFQSAR